jgi:3-oxoacyl-[acyl-carrier-protein] synthase-3
VLGADGAQADLLYAERDERVLRMQGSDVYRHAVRRHDRRQPRGARARRAHRRRHRPLRRPPGQRPHHRAAAAELGIRARRSSINVDRVANTSSASIPLALEQAEREGRLKPGDTSPWPPSAPASCGARAS